jgi:hypothetical protein
MEDILLSMNDNVELQEKRVFKIYVSGIISFAAIAISLIILSTVGNFFYIPFLIAIYFCVDGFIRISKFKKSYSDIYDNNRTKLQISKWLLRISLIIILASIILALAFVVYIGMYGFGR